MKKISLLLLAFVFISAGAFANPKGKKKSKKSDSKGFYAISVGPSLAMGDYAKDFGSSEKAGGAKMGLHINIGNFGYKIVPNFGIAGLINLGANRVNANVPPLNSDDKDAYWVYTGFMVGPLLTFDPAEQISLDFRPVFGLAYVAAPEINLSSTNDAVLVKSDQATGFGMNIGASCRYHASGNLDLALNFDYFSASPKFKDNYKDSKQKVNVLGITAGLAFRF